MFQDLRYSVRMLLKNKAFTVVAVLTLALGIGANTAIFSVVNAVLLRPLPYPESERLMEAGRAFIGSDEVSALSEQKFVFLRDHAQSFEAITATTGARSEYQPPGESQVESLRGIHITEHFFRALGVNPANGRGFTGEEDSPAGERVVILGDAFWRRSFGADIDLIGKTITLNDLTRTVVGIMPSGFEYFGPQDVFMPMRVDPARQNEGHNWTVLGRLKQGVTPDEAGSELKQLFDQFQAAHPRSVQQNEIFGATSWRASMTRSIRELLWILLGAVSFILLIACVNIANLQLTRATARRKEMAIRVALGAGGGRLMRQLLTEGAVLALLGGAVGLLLSLWGMKAMLALVPAGMLPRAGEIDLDGRVLAFAMAASLLTGIVFSLVPALQTLRVDVNRALKEGGGKTGASAARGPLRSMLVVVEVALALTLTVGAGLLLRTFANLRAVEPGFDAHNVLTFEIAPPARKYDKVAKLKDLYSRALEGVGKLPGVESAALTNKLPFDRWFNLPYRLAGQSDWSGSTEYRLISPDYFRVIKMAVRQGRPFNEGDTAGAEPVVIVNEAFARRNFANVEPIGQQLCVACEYGDPALRRVVGVVNETKQRSLSEAAPVTVFIPLTQTAEGVRQVAQQASFLLRTAGDPLLLSGAIQDEMRQLDSTAPVKNLRSLEQLVGSSIAPQRFNLSLLSLFAGLGLLLAAVGIYGVMAYSVAQRTHEIGLRMALGAQNGDVLKLVVGQGMSLAIGGVVLGLLASAGLTRLLKSFLFGVKATDPLTFAAVSLLLISVALLACYFPARRATKVDPMIALRYE